MKKIRVSENELVDLIEKLVKENLGNGNGHNFGMMGTPTSKYKDLYEDDDVEGKEEVDEETLDVNVDDETQDGLDQEAAMESIKESKVVSRLRKKVHTKQPTKTIKEQQKQIDILTDRITKLENK